MYTVYDSFDNAHLILCMYVCMYVCIYYLCIYLCMYVCMYVLCMLLLHTEEKSSVEYRPRGVARIDSAEGGSYISLPPSTIPGKINSDTIMIISYVSSSFMYFFWGSIESILELLGRLSTSPSPVYPSV